MDFEASALRDGFPIEVGLALVRDAEVIANSMLIMPSDEWLTPAFRWDSAAQEIHGIPLQRLMLDGHHPSKVCRELNRILSGKVAVFDTGAAGVDRYWLDVLFSESEEARTFALGDPAGDVLRSMALAAGVSDTGLSAIFSAAPPLSHRAAPDASRYAWCAIAIQIASRHPKRAHSVRFDIKINSIHQS